MKVKLNLSGDGIKQFFFHNGEKIVLGVTALILLLFLYSAITAKPIDDSKSPDSIKSTSARVRSQIEESTPPPPAPPVNFVDRIVSDEKPISIEGMRLRNEFRPPVFQELSPRTDPVLFAPEEVTVHADRGIVPYNPNANLAAAPPVGYVPSGPAPGVRRSTEHDEVPEVGLRNRPRAEQPAQVAQLATEVTIAGQRVPNAEPKAKYWAVITALVPVEKQAEAYRRAFEYALPAGIVDVPRYLGFRIQRAEVNDAKDTNLTWEYIKYKEAVDDMANWAVPQAPELADPQYVFPRELVNIVTPSGTTLPITTYVTWPLPPLYLKNWGVEAVHPKTSLFKAPDVAQAAQPIQQPGAVDFSVPFPKNAAGAPPVDGAIGAQNGVPADGAATVPPAPANRLFRFVDLTAEPGKTYRYRVQLVLVNPNYVQPAGTASGALQPVMSQHLAKAESGRSPWRESPPSEPSAPITIPREFRILAESSSVWAGIREPKAKIDVLTMIKTGPDPAVAAAAAAQPGTPAHDVWLEVSKDLELPLGSIAYLADTTIDKVPDMTIEQVRQKVEKVTIETNQSMLLDVRNDDPLAINSKSKTTPTEMLFIDATGRLATVNSGADNLALKEFRNRTTLPVDPNLIPVPVPVVPKPGLVPGQAPRLRERDRPGAG